MFGNPQIKSSDPVWVELSQSGRSRLINHHGSVTVTTAERAHAIALDLAETYDKMATRMEAMAVILQDFDTVDIAQSVERVKALIKAESFAVILFTLGASDDDIKAAVAEYGKAEQGVLETDWKIYLTTTGAMSRTHPPYPNVQPYLWGGYVSTWDYFTEKILPHYRAAGMMPERAYSPYRRDFQFSTHKELQEFLTAWGWHLADGKVEGSNVSGVCYHDDLEVATWSYFTSRRRRGWRINVYDLSAKESIFVDKESVDSEGC